MGFTCSQSSWGGTQERWKWTHFHTVPTWCHTRVSLEHSVITAPELQHTVGRCTHIQQPFHASCTSTVSAPPICPTHLLVMTLNLV